MRAAFSSADSDFVVADRAGRLFDVAAEHDVGAAAGHVGGDGDHAGAAGLGDDLGLARVLLGVEHLVRQLFLVEQQPDSSSEFSIEVVPTSTGWPRWWQARMSAMMAACFSARCGRSGRSRPCGSSAGWSG
jgi:hypothetical protein